MHKAIMLAATILALTWGAVVSAADPYVGVDPLWVLLHEPAVLDELKLSSDQRRAYQVLLDGLDRRFFPLRNKSSSEALAGMSKIVAEAQEKLQPVLKPAQRKRLGEILLWRTGIAALLREDVVTRLRYTETQRKRIQEVFDETQSAVAALEKQVSEGKPREPLEKQFTELKAEEQTRVVKLLKSEQRTAWKEMLGPQFDVSKLGQPRFKAPELIDSGEWINSSPLELKKLQGKVVVVHFYACGCINCIHNYPWYREWYDRFKDKDVVILGIHTPETAGEREIATVRRKAAEEKFPFPVLIDVKSDNWNAWGNSMWPCVYLIDKQGYLRQFWPGELKWNGSDGEKYMRGLIERLQEE